MALPLIHEDSTITITTPLQSRAYVDITLAVLREFGIEVIVTDNNETTDPANCPVYHIKGGQRYTTPHIDAGRIHPEGDWSNGAFWLVADALGSDINVSNLRDDSPQGDKAITEIIKKYNSVRLDNECNDEMPDTCDKEIAIDASGIPDLVPIISVLAALSPVHTRIVNAGRLRIKESDRLKTTCEMLGALGANISETEDGLEIEGRESLDGGTAHGAGDHRIVMAAAIAATCCKKPVTIIGAEAAAKSYPRFFEDYAWLGGVISIIS